MYFHATRGGGGSGGARSGPRQRVRGESATAEMGPMVKGEILLRVRRAIAKAPLPGRDAGRRGRGVGEDDGQRRNAHRRCGNERGNGRDVAFAVGLRGSQKLNYPILCSRRVHNPPPSSRVTDSA